MNKITLTLLLTLSWIAIQLSSAATIPAGTTLIVQTNETISSNDPVGKTFGAALHRDIVIGGKVLLRGGTQMVGRVESRRGSAFTAVILNVTQIASQGHLVGIKTVEGFRADGSRFKTRTGVSVGRGGFFQLSAGTIMKF